jgi:murein DD-endopeptidase MepM/ murein hydrolase activator NlpD
MEKYYENTVQYQQKIDCTPSFLPVDGEITSPFGYRRNPFGYYTSEFHTGLDIACAYGSPIKATADGTVTFAGWDGYWGRRVEIDHGFGVVTFYAHNSQIKVKVGDKIKKGEIIALAATLGEAPARTAITRLCQRPIG